jgi:hypothetical protein
MTSERARAYTRVMRTLDELGPAKLHIEEQDQIREAADTLIFSADTLEDAAALEALTEIDYLCRGLVASGRWELGAATRLADDLADCGSRGAVAKAA